MLTLTFLGVGSAFAKRNFQSNALIEAWSMSPSEQAKPDDTLLVDFGATGPMSLAQLKSKPGFEYLDSDGMTNYPEIHKILVTHQHADHIGGLEELALMNMFVFGKGAEKHYKPQLISTDSILLNLWDTSLKGGLCALPGRVALLQDYFFILSLHMGTHGQNTFQMMKRYEFSVFPTDHLRIQHSHDWPSIGLYVTDNKTGECAFFSSDTKFDYQAYSRMLQDASVNFHDVQLTSRPDAVHATLEELQTMPDDVKKKTYLYHYSDNWDKPKYAFVQNEFRGFAEQHKRYVLFE